MKEILGWMYGVEILLLNENIQEILQIATYLQMKKLIIEVMSYIRDKCFNYHPFNSSSRVCCADIEIFYFFYNDLIVRFNLLVYYDKPHPTYISLQEQVDFAISSYFKWLSQNQHKTCN